MNLKVDGLTSKGSKSSIDHEGIETALTNNSDFSTDEEDEEEQIRYFNDIKLQALITICVVNPSKMPTYLIHQLIAGDFSIHDRLMIINSIGLSARELKGYKDKVNYDNVILQERLKAKSLLNSGKTIPGRKLNGAGHLKFLVLDENYGHQIGSQGPLSLQVEAHRMDNITSQISKVANRKSKELIDDKLIQTDQGKVVKISQRLLKQRASKQNENNSLSGVSNVDDGDNYSTNCYAYFIGPFLTVWYHLQGNMRSLGNYSNTIITNYLKNLTVLVHCAYPTCINLVEIIGEIFEVLTSLKSVLSLLISNNSLEDVSLGEISAILECQLYLLLVILNSTNPVLLISQFQSQIVDWFSWLNYMFDNYSNIFGEGEMFKNGKSLTANCLLQINEILEDQFGDLNNA